MSDCRQEVRWSPRLPKHKLRRLYEQDALGIRDEDLLEEVGWCLYMRCRDILAVQRALKDGQVRCPRCDARQAASYVPRRTRDVDEVLGCPQCGWELTWGEFWRSFRHRQLHPGGAVPAFERFVGDWERARSGGAKMLAVDRVVHAFHYSLQDQPERPCRAAAVNLISGRLKDVVEFLDSLAYGAGSAPELRRVHARWQAGIRASSWMKLPSDEAGRDAP